MQVKGGMDGCGGGGGVGEGKEYILHIENYNETL